MGPAEMGSWQQKEGRVVFLIISAIVLDQLMARLEFATSPKSVRRANPMQREFLTHYVARVEVLNADCPAGWIEF
jgi:hypothetical protein